MTKGGRNLIILGVGAVLVAILTTTVSLLIYHNSGDIYIDRSRPGFLPEEEEEKPETDEDFDFSQSGKITKEVLEEYLEKISKETEALKSFDGAFDSQILSDEYLGINE